jgi:hypothetical protein
VCPESGALNIEGSLPAAYQNNQKLRMQPAKSRKQEIIQNKIPWLLQQMNEKKIK